MLLETHVEGLCAILGCEVVDAMARLIRANTDTEALYARMEAQIASYRSVGVRTPLTNQEIEQGIYDAEGALGVLDQSPTCVPEPLRSDYRSMLMDLLVDLSQMS